MGLQPTLARNAIYLQNIWLLEGDAFRQSKMLLLQLSPKALRKAGIQNPPIFYGIVAANQVGSSTKSVHETIKAAEEKREKGRE